MENSDEWKGPTPYEKDLTEETFSFCTNLLTKLPFTKTDEDIEPNMITIRNKKNVAEHPDFQIWRVSDQDNDYYVAGYGHMDDPTELILPAECYTGKFMIEMSCGEDPICLDQTS